MIVQKAIKFRIYPTSEQEQQLAIEFGHNRFIYNHYLDQHSQPITINKKGKLVKTLTWNGVPWTGYIDASRDFTRLKEDFQWLKDASRTTITSTLRHLQDAFNRFFKKQTEYPTFKLKHDDQSVTYQDIDVGEDFIKIPKCGTIKAKITCEVGEVKQITDRKSVV